jgi:arginine decarboxylase
LRDAGIQYCNLVTVSSIIPPGCKLIPKEKGVKMLQPGQITFVVLSRNETDEPHRLIGACVGVGMPPVKGQYGYLSEHHSSGQTEKVMGDYAEDLAATMLATTMGVEFDADAAWDEREQLYRTRGLTIKSSNASQSAIGDKNGLWTTAIAAAVFII